jgi:hypothetical protein
MSAVKIRAYGLIPITRRAYLILQTCCFTALFLAFAWIAVSPPDAGLFRAKAANADPAVRAPIEWFAAALDQAGWILLGIIAFGVLETFWMLRKFRIAEAEAAAAERARSQTTASVS